LATLSTATYLSRNSNDWSTVTDVYVKQTVSIEADEGLWVR